MTIIKLVENVPYFLVSGRVSVRVKLTVRYMLELSRETV